MPVLCDVFRKESMQTNIVLKNEEEIELNRFVLNLSSEEYTRIYLSKYIYIIFIVSYRMKAKIISNYQIQQAELRCHNDLQKQHLSAKIY